MNSHIHISDTSLRAPSTMKSLKQYSPNGHRTFPTVSTISTSISTPGNLTASSSDRMSRYSTHASPHFERETEGTLLSKAYRKGKGGISHSSDSNTAHKEEDDRYYELRDFSTHYPRENSIGNEEKKPIISQHENGYAQFIVNEGEGLTDLPDEMNGSFTLYNSTTHLRGNLKKLMDFMFSMMEKLRGGFEAYSKYLEDGGLSSAGAISLLVVSMLVGCITITLGVFLLCLLNPHFGFLVLLFAPFVGIFLGSVSWSITELFQIAQKNMSTLHILENEGPSRLMLVFLILLYGIFSASWLAMWLCTFMVLGGYFLMSATFQVLPIVTVMRCTGKILFWSFTNYGASIGSLNLWAEILKKSSDFYGPCNVIRLDFFDKSYDTLKNPPLLPFLEENGRTPHLSEGGRKLLLMESVNGAEGFEGLGEEQMIPPTENFIKSCLRRVALFLFDFVDGVSCFFLSCLLFLVFGHHKAAVMMLSNAIIFTLITIVFTKTQQYARSQMLSIAAGNGYICQDIPVNIEDEMQVFSKGDGYPSSIGHSHPTAISHYEDMQCYAGDSMQDSREDQWVDENEDYRLYAPVSNDLRPLPSMRQGAYGDNTKGRQMFTSYGMSSI